MKAIKQVLAIQWNAEKKPYRELLALTHLLLGLSTTWRSTRKLRADATTVQMTLARFCPTTTGRAVAANQPAATQNKALLTPRLSNA
jgi:hypothetical protein